MYILYVYMMKTANIQNYTLHGFICLQFIPHTRPLLLMDTILKVEEIYRFSLGVYMYKNCSSIDFSRQHGYVIRGRQSLLPT